MQNKAELRVAIWWEKAKKLGSPNKIQEAELKSSSGGSGWIVTFLASLVVARLCRGRAEHQQQLGQRQQRRWGLAEIL